MEFMLNAVVMMMLVAFPVGLIPHSRPVPPLAIRN